MKQAKLIIVLAFLALLILSCQAPEPIEVDIVASPPPTEIIDPQLVPSFYEGMTMTLLSFSGSNAVINVAGLQRIILVNRVVADVYIERYDTGTHHETLDMDYNWTGEITGTVISNSDTEDYVLIIAGNYQPSKSDTIINGAWPAFVKQATNEEKPIFLNEPIINDLPMPGDKCEIMRRIHGLELPWIFTLPEICHHDNPSRDFISEEFKVNLDNRDFPTLSCGEQIGGKYIVHQIERVERGSKGPDWKGLDWLHYQFPMKITFYDPEKSYICSILPANTNIAYGDNWYKLSTEECSEKKASDPTAEPEYTNIQVPSEKYHSLYCISYRALGGATTNSPNYDSECVYKYSTKKVRIP